METEVREISINGVTYIPKGEITPATELNGMKYVICRTYSAGVFAGYLKSKEFKDGHYAVTLKRARRLWQWFGASLSQVAESGISDESKCKFPEEVSVIDLSAIEIIYCTEKSRLEIQAVKVWKV